MRQGSVRASVLSAAALLAGAAQAGSGAASATQPTALRQGLLNRGDDPFFQISSQLAHCPVPLGPLESADDWLAEAHYRIERGNSCWNDGRCRLPNAYLYDKDIADAVRRRLRRISAKTPGWQQSTLWVMVQRRWVYLMGCVQPGFDVKPMLDALAQSADVERVIDQTTSTPQRGTPYPQLHGAATAQ